MTDRPVSAWSTAATTLWAVTVGLLILSTLEGPDSCLLQMWALAASAASSTVTVGWFAARQTEIVQRATMVRQDAREHGLVPIDRRR